MKKLISVLSIVLVLAMLVPCLFSCKKNDENPAETPIEYTNIVDGGASNYQIVFAENATTAVKTLASKLENEIKNKTGVKLERVSDNTAKYPAKANEILLSVSKRTETTTALESMTEVGYKMEYTNGKLIVVASNDYMLEKAVDALLNTHLVSEGSVLKIDNKLNVSYSGAAEMSALVGEDGKFKYKIVYPGGADQEITKAVSTIRATIKSLLGCTADMSTDSAKEVEYELLIGLTNRQQSKDLYKSLALLETRSAISGTKLVIGAGMDERIGLATNNFSSALQEAVKGTYDKNYMLRLDFSNSRMVYEYLDGVPMLSRERQVGTDDVGDGSIVMVWSDITANEYTQYVNDIKAAGFTVQKEYNLGSNRHALLKSEATTLYTSYIPAEKMVRVFAEKADASGYNTADKTTYATVANYVPTMWQLNVDNKNSAQNGGMSYVMKIADGSFVIIDGGYNTETEADNLYNHLKANSADAKPVISAWFITHQHGDHYGALQAFTPKYKDKVVVKGFYFNFPANDFTLSGSMEGSMVSWMNEYAGAKIYRKLHSGMTFWFADAKFEIIYTHEDMYPSFNVGKKVANGNDTSTVIKMTFGGKTVTFLGDIELSASRIIERYYVNDKATLQSDFVQFAHHGYQGATKELYDMIEAPTVLWPMNIYGWQTPDATNVFENWHTNKACGSDTNAQELANYYICYEATYVKTIVVAGEGTTKFELPSYTPRSNKLPNYKSIHDQIAKDNFVVTYNLNNDPDNNSSTPPEGTVTAPYLGTISYQRKTAGDKLFEDITVTRTGYVFEGWYTNAGCTTKFTATVMPANNITLYAKWKKQ